MIQNSAPDDKSMQDMLRELAALTICGHQLRCAGIIEAAVEQWKSELEAQDVPEDETSNPSTRPRDTLAGSDDEEESSQLMFTPYQTFDVDRLLAREFDQIMDRRISQKFNNRDWNDRRDYLYIFECEEAKGMCKLGRTSNPPRRARDQEKCYRRLRQRWTLYCPNSEVFERVVQLELAERRYQHECRSCTKTHTEWFKADLEEMVKRAKVWCQLSCHLQTCQKRLQLTLPLAGVSSDPDRWYKWAQRWVQTWDDYDSQAAQETPDRSVINHTRTADASLDIDNDTQSVPGLSPSSSSPGTPDDDYSVPPTPTPIHRSRNQRPPLGPRLAIPTELEPKVDEVYWTPVETMATPGGPTLFPMIPGAFPVSPLKGVSGQYNDYDVNGMDDILESIRLLIIPDSSSS
jgi:hypothetical protein